MNLVRSEVKGQIKKFHFINPIFVLRSVRKPVIRAPRGRPAKAFFGEKLLEAATESNSLSLSLSLQKQEASNFIIQFLVKLCEWAF